MADSKTKTHTDEKIKKTTPNTSDGATEKKKRRRKPRKKTAIVEKTGATEKEVIKELITTQATQNTPESVATSEVEHTVAGIDDLQAYIASKKNSAPEKTMPSNNDLLAADGTNLLSVPGIFAVVPHAKGDHKLVFKKENMPEGLLDDPKNRIPGTLYKKNGAAIYLVNLIMKEHPTLRDARGNNYDVWIIDDEKQLNEQLQSIKNGMGGGENFGSPLIAGKEAPSIVTPAVTNTPLEEITKEEVVKEDSVVIDDTPKTESPVEAIAPVESEQEEAVVATDNEIVKESQEETIVPDSIIESNPELIQETASAGETELTDEKSEAGEHHPFKSPDSELNQETPVAVATMNDTGEHPFTLPDIDINTEPTIDMNSLESIDKTLAEDTDAVNLNFHDAIIEETAPEATTNEPETVPMNDNPVEEVNNEGIDLNLEIPETENTEQNSLSGNTPSNDNPNETQQTEVINQNQNENNAISLDIHESEEDTNTTSTPEAGSPMFTPIATEVPNNEPEFNLDDLQIEEVTNENPTTISVETMSSPSTPDNTNTTVSAAVSTVPPTPVDNTNTSTTVIASKKGIPMATKLRLVGFVLIIFCLGIIAFVMFPKNKGEKNSDNTGSVDTEVENTVIDELPIEDLDQNNNGLNENENETDPVDENTGEQTDPETNLDPIDTAPIDNTIPDNGSDVFNGNTPPDSDQNNSNPSGSLTIAELKIKLEAQQADARKMLNVAKLIDNKAAIKFSLAANLKAGNVLDRIDTDTTITADDVASEVATIDRYLEEANKLVE